MARIKHKSTKRYLTEIEKLYEKKRKLSDRISAIKRADKLAKKRSRK